MNRAKLLSKLLKRFIMTDRQSIDAEEQTKSQPSSRMRTKHCGDIYERGVGADSTPLSADPKLNFFLGEFMMMQ